MEKIYLENIKALRIDRDITQQEIAIALNITQNAYSQYERGVRTMPIEILIKICKFYKVPADDILGLSGRRMPLPPEKGGN